MSKENRTHGLEVEHSLVNKEGIPLPLETPEFERILNIVGQGKFHTSKLNGKQYVIGTITNEYGELGLDAAKSLPEVAVKPTVPGEKNALQVISERALTAIAITNKAVMDLHSMEVAPSISMSHNPLASRDKQTYERLVTPKGVYEILWKREWDHTAGIHAAHTSPWTSVELSEAVSALSVILALSGPQIAIFGNSPFIEGQVTGAKESRQNMWPRLLGNSRFPQDMKLVGMPDKMPESLAHYFHMMFQTPMMLVTAASNSGDYKTSGLYTLEGYPRMHEYLAKESWTGHELGNPELSTIQITTSVGDFVTQQFMQFWDARWRFELAENHGLTPNQLRTAMQNDKLEELLEPHLKLSCIEGRAPGTALPTDKNPDENPIAAPSAMQAGLINNLDQAITMINKYPWDFWRNARKQAIVNGLEAEVDGVSLLNLARDTVQIASAGLTSSEQSLMEPVLEIVNSGKSRADRLLEEYNEIRQSAGTDQEAIRQVMEQNRMSTKVIASLTQGL